jgi:hypothetical protein
MAGKLAPDRAIQVIVFGYVAALIGVVVALVVRPFSNVLMLALVALLGLFFVVSGVAIAHAFILVISRGASLGVLRHARARTLSSQRNRLSKATHPGNIPLSRIRLRRLCPELFESCGNPLAWLDRRNAGGYTLPDSRPSQPRR